MAPGGKRGNGMSTIETGGPAFPLQSIGPEFAPGYAGMTLRDYFAARALQGLMANKSNPLHFNPEDDAAYVYRIADAMLKAREAA